MREVPLRPRLFPLAAECVEISLLRRGLCGLVCGLELCLSRLRRVHLRLKSRRIVALALLFLGDTPLLLRLRHRAAMILRMFRMLSASATLCCRRARQSEKSGGDQMDLLHPALRIRVLRVCELS